MKKLLILPLILLSSIANSQNLVPNPSFEDTVQCPDSWDQLNRAIGWSAFRASPDYFNVCAGGNLVGIPDNIAGTQTPRSGNAYAGLGSYYVYGEFPRECLGVKLIQTLVIGHTYYVSFYISRAVNNVFNLNLATNKTGAKFSTVPYTYPNPVAIDNLAQIFSDSVISDTLNWVEIQGYFVADSTYDYLIIGNFFSDSLITHVSFDSSATWSYYYLDDVSVVDSTISGIESTPLAETEIFLFYNGELTIKANEIESVEILDMTGRKCKTYNGNVPEKINLNNLPKGLYLVLVNTTHKSFVKKILIN